MSQITDLGSDNFMQPTPQSKGTQNMLACRVSSASTLSSRSSADTFDTSDTVNTMRPNMGYSYSNTSDTSTPASTRSSLSYESNVSSSSSAPRPKRSSLKPSVKSSEFLTTTSNRRSSPPTVRFAEPEPTPKSHTWPRSKPNTIQLPDPLINKIPNPLIQSQYQRRRTFPSPMPSPNRQRSRIYPNKVPSPPHVQRPLSLAPSHVGAVPSSKNHASGNESTPASPLLLDPRWSGIPFPAHYTPPAPAPGSRVASYQSAVSATSSFSTQSAPAVLETQQSSSTPPGQYNPLEHYIPCMHPSCTSHYTPVHAGLSYCFTQGPYDLSRLHALCPRHAAKEVKDANAQCKREWEHGRQNAGRKMLGVIAAEFEAFLEGFREDRRTEDARSQHDQKLHVLGEPKSPDHTNNGKAAKLEMNSEWDWRYTPRPCTTAQCKTFYSPFANHLYAFYRTPRSQSKFLPLPHRCASCSKSEVEGFEDKVREKWNSRCGWDDGEWSDWFKNAINDRQMECEFWLKAQERIVRENEPARLVSRSDEREEVREVEEKKKVGRKSVFRRWFASMTG